MTPTPTYGDPQTAVLIVFIAIAVTLVGVFAAIALRARRDVPFERVREVAYRLRKGWLAFLVLLLGTMVGVSLFLLPYPSEAGSRASVTVIGGQFFWSMSPESVPAGTPIQFEVTSVDVNHGFGIYDPDGHLIGNVQAMPGYTNKLDLTLEKPGSYFISCLEFCGADHHLMNREFEVTP